MADPKDIFRGILEEGARRIAPEVFSSGGGLEIHIERPKNPEHGDLSSNVAMQLSKKLRRNPRELAQAFIDEVSSEVLDSGFAVALTVAGAGFLNVRLNPAAKLQSIRQVLEEGREYGRTKGASSGKIQIEFVSANPTGPLHVGHGRQGALGDAIAALLESQGHQVSREFYYNDAGAQIEKLALSVQARTQGIKPGAPGWPAEGYAGEYIEDIARDFLSKNKTPGDLESIRTHAVSYLRKEQDADLQAFGVKFDNYYLESSLYSEGKVENVVEGWKANKKTYESEGALWLRTTRSLSSP